MPINLGAALGGLSSGYANQANTAWEQKQKQDALIRQQQQQAALYQVMQGMQPTPQGQPQQPIPPQAPPPSGMPGAPPSPLAKPGGDAAVLAALGSPQQQATAQPNPSPARPQQPPGATGTPPPDIFSKIMGAVSNSKLQDWQKGAALQDMMGIMAPMWAAQKQADMEQFDKWYKTQDIDVKRENAGAHVTSADAAADRADKAAARQDQSDKDRIAGLKDEYNQAESDYRAALNNPQIKPAAFKELKDARDTAKKEYDTALSGKGKKAASGKADTAPTAEEVTVISPDGAVGTIPASQLKDALAAGYKQQ